MNSPRHNHAASVRQRLANLAKTRGVEFQRILVLYAQERLLHRLSVSKFADRFILKGASLSTGATIVCEPVLSAAAAGRNKRPVSSGDRYVWEAGNAHQLTVC